jgi:hypothetical protein
MPYIKDPDNDALWVNPEPLTPEEEKSVREFIARAKTKHAPAHGSKRESKKQQHKGRPKQPLQ